MKARLLAICAVVASVLLGTLAFSDNSYAVKCPPGSLHENDDDVSSYAECNLPSKNEGDKDLIPTVVDIINVVVGVVGILAVVAIVIGAIFFVISTGDSAKTTRARNTILYGVVGLIVSLLAFAIVNFVLSSVFGGGGTTTVEEKTKDGDD